MKILINLVLSNPKNSLSIAKNFIHRISKEVKVNLFLHSPTPLEIDHQIKKSFIYPNGFDFKTILKHTLITINDLEINEFNQYDVIFTISDYNYKNFIRLLDTPTTRIKHMMKSIFRSPKRVIVPLRFSEPFNSIESLNDKIFISNIQVFRIFSSMALRSEGPAPVVFGFLLHRLGIPVSGVED